MVNMRLAVSLLVLAISVGYTLTLRGSDEPGKPSVSASDANERTRLLNENAALKARVAQLERELDDVRKGAKKLEELQTKFLELEKQHDEIIKRFGGSPYDPELKNVPRDAVQRQFNGDTFYLVRLIGR